jgi:phosphatidylglycerophosphate synthase
VAGILDGTDGKLARLGGKKTLIGKLEHSFDVLFESCPDRYLVHFSRL